MTGTAELHRLALAHVVRQRARVEREAERELAALREAIEAAQLATALAELRGVGRYLDKQLAEMGVAVDQPETMP